MAATREQFIQAWIDALESGEYKQTRGHLKDDDGYCCLGVGCEVHSKLYPRTTLKWRTYGGYYTYGSNPFALPDVVRKRLGVSIDLQETLVDMNDGGFTFHEIAEEIKDKLVDKNR